MIEAENPQQMCQQDRKEQFHKWLHVIVQFSLFAHCRALWKIHLNHLFHGLAGFLDLPPEARP
jgi:hypothetical protein